eukprot:TRINITY_DN65370_c0_g1_i1.p1 TRINITY_DN65370_c0_g1~~TRINITY_DN65370_c0_g1_i1.p1  ORF type:complete len:462 (+),score=136.74 TRINITY_DN65370_c0_g1_i1:47-1387(+)
MDRMAVLQQHLDAGNCMVQPTSGSTDAEELKAIATIRSLAEKHGLDLSNGTIRRTSSRFCLGVEHGDYNGTELFGVGTDRFIWLGYKPRSDNKVRIVSGNFEKDGVVQWTLGDVPPPRSPENAHSWARFAFGADYVLHKNGYGLTTGLDAVVIGNIPGGGMSRSASLSINLVLTLMEINRLQPKRTPLNSDGRSYEIVELAREVETQYIGSPSGNLDQIMIYYAKAGLGTHYLPQTNEVRYVPLGCDPDTFTIGALDTGTDRPGLEKSTYKIRKDECDALSELLAQKFPGVKRFGDLNDQQYQQVLRDIAPLSPKHKDMVDRLTYIHEAKQRFGTMLQAWKSGDIATVGKVFRQDGHGLRDVYKISGPELECMCDIVRSVPGVMGERMLGGGDKGASGCLIQSGSEQHVRAAVTTAYPRCFPAMQNKFAVHFVKVCDGVTTLQGRL